MLALFDTFDDATKELLQSLETAGVTFTSVVIRYDGELPEGAQCPFVTYTGIERKGDPVFFNEVPVPAWCEIRQGAEVYGEILRDGYALGRINYEANSFRQVESVDWLLRDGSLGHTDHYDRYGNHYATTYYSRGVAYQTVYRGPREWEIEVNHVSRIVTMRSPRTLLTFATLTEFVSYFIDDQRLADDPVLINSLSYPLFVMRKRAAEPNTTLFWQEPMPGDVPENMATELEQPRALARIVFCDERLLRKVATSYPDTALELTYLSHVGQFADKQGYDPRRAFTLTNSDEIPALVELLEAFPDVTFSVAALTLMSEKLHGLGRGYANLILIPTINHTGIREELDKASVYLDINAGPHVLDVVKAAYYLNLVVLAVTPYAKAPDYSRTFTTTEELKAQLSAAIGSSEERTRALDELHSQRGPLSTPADYRRLFALPGVAPGIGRGGPTVPKAVKGIASRKPPEPSASHSDVADWTERQVPHLQPIVKLLDETIRATIPGLHYAVKGKRPYYGLPELGWIIELAAYDVSVNVLFFGGADFDRPPPLGTTDRTRYVKVTTLDEVRQPEMHEWIVEASRTPGWR